MTLPFSVNGSNFQSADKISELVRGVAEREYALFKKKYDWTGELWWYSEEDDPSDITVPTGVDIQHADLYNMEGELGGVGGGGNYVITSLQSWVENRCGYFLPHTVLDYTNKEIKTIQQLYDAIGGAESSGYASVFDFWCTEYVGGSFYDSSTGETGWLRSEDGTTWADRGRLEPGDYLTGEVSGNTEWIFVQLITALGKLLFHTEGLGLTGDFKVHDYLQYKGEGVSSSYYWAAKGALNTFAEDATAAISGVNYPNLVAGSIGGFLKTDGGTVYYFATCRAASFVPRLVFRMAGKAVIYAKGEKFLAGNATNAYATNGTGMPESQNRAIQQMNAAAESTVDGSRIGNNTFPATLPEDIAANEGAAYAGMYFSEIIAVIEPEYSHGPGYQQAGVDAGGSETAPYFPEAPTTTTTDAPTTTTEEDTTTTAQITTTEEWWETSTTTTTHWLD